MKRWIAPSILALFVVGMLIYGINFYQQEQIEQAKEPIRGEIIVYTDLPNTLTAMLAERYEEEQKVKVTVMPLTEEQKALSVIAHDIYTHYPYDGKYIIDEARLIICQSNASTAELSNMYPPAEVNPLGDWTGGTDVDTGATNRKLGSDMADSVTGGGLHGKDLSKADVTLNIYAFLKAQETGKPVQIACAIGDDTIDGHPYQELVDIAAEYITSVGGFEKFAEWGLF